MCKIGIKRVRFIICDKFGPLDLYDFVILKAKEVFKEVDHDFSQILPAFVCHVDCINKPFMSDDVVLSFKN